MPKRLRATWSTPSSELLMPHFMGPRYRPSGQDLPPQEIKLPPTFQTILGASLRLIEVKFVAGCNDGPFKNLDHNSSMALARPLRSFKMLLRCFKAAARALHQRSLRHPRRLRLFMHIHATLRRAEDHRRAKKSRLRAAFFTFPRFEDLKMPLKCL